MLCIYYKRFFLIIRYEFFIGSQQSRLCTRLIESTFRNLNFFLDCEF